MGKQPGIIKNKLQILIYVKDKTNQVNSPYVHLLYLLSDDQIIQSCRDYHVSISVSAMLFTV
jgi:hypothetical protein